MVDMTGVAFSTEIVTNVVTGLKFAVSDGVNVRLWLLDPAEGFVEAVVHPKLPATLASPPVKLDSVNVCP
jgi:hypothetical protein